MESLLQSVTPVPGFSSASAGWTAVFLQLLEDGREDAALKELSRVTTRLKGANDFSQLREGLRQIDFSRLPDVALVGLLRNVFSVRSQLEDWGSLVSRVEQLLGERNSDSRALLRGLKP